MRKTFPSFRRGQSFEEFDKLPKKDKEDIQNYLKYVSITSSSATRLENNKRTLINLRYTIEKSFDKITLEDLREYLSMLNSSKNTNSSQNEYKATTKRFLKWKFKDWSERFQDLSDIKLHMKINEEKINAGTLLKAEDIKKIMNTEKQLFWKSFFISLYESGLRPIELRQLLWKDVRLEIEGDLTEIHIFATKTSKARSVYVKEATFYLKKLKESSDCPLVFPSVKDHTKPLDKGVVANWLKRLSLKALDRPVTPYLLRHTRATELYTNANIPDKIVQKFLGHSKSMSDVYTHMSNEDVKESMGNSVYNIDDMPREKKHELELKVERMEKQLFEISKKLLNEEDKKKSN